MDHIVYVDFKEKELDKLIRGEKSMIIRGATGRKLPYGRVFQNDILYFINNNGEGLVKAICNVKEVYNSDKMTTEESIELVTSNNNKLNLSNKQFKRWAGKRYIVLVEVDNIKKIESFEIDKSNYGNMDDWLLVEDIYNVKIR
ncbi:hypothetical protein RJG79_09850 [Mycoplasmatota bacterium WC44]